MRRQGFAAAQLGAPRGFGGRCADKVRRLRELEMWKRVGSTAGLDRPSTFKTPSQARAKQFGVSVDITRLA